jgi:hypothetical protein
MHLFLILFYLVPTCRMHEASPPCGCDQETSFIQAYFFISLDCSINSNTPVTVKLRRKHVCGHSKGLNFECLITLIFKFQITMIGQLL